MGGAAGRRDHETSELPTFVHAANEYVPSELKMISQAFGEPYASRLFPPTVAAPLMSVIEVRKSEKLIGLGSTLRIVGFVLGV